MKLKSLSSLVKPQLKMNTPKPDSSPEDKPLKQKASQALIRVRRGRLSNGESKQNKVFSRK